MTVNGVMAVILRYFSQLL